MGTKKPQRKGKTSQITKGKSNGIGRWTLLLLFLFGAGLYVNTLNHGYVLDDHSVIDENYVVKQGFEGIPTIVKTPYRYGYWSNKGTLYRPASLVMFAIEWELFPDNPQAGHAVNIVLYGLTGVLLFIVLNSLFRSQHAIALIATLIFLAHPIHTEVVANIKGRDDISCLLFLLAAVWNLLRYVDAGKFLSIIFSWICFFLAIMSKENAVTFLAVFPLALVFFRKTSPKALVLPMAGFLAGLATYLALRYQVLGSIGGIGVARIDNALAGAHSTAEWYATATWILGKYLLMLFFPHPLSNDYAYNQIPLVGWDNLGVIVSALLILAILAYAIWKIKTRSILIFGILLSVITMSIYTNYFITIGTHFAERLLYIPSLGFALVVAWGLVKAFSYSERETLFRKKGLIAALGVLLILFSGKTISRNPAWESDLVLHQTDVETSSNSARVHYFLGLEVMKVQAMEAKDKATMDRYLMEAVTLFEKALDIYPSYYQVYNQLGLAHYRLGNFDKALESYEIGTEHVPQAIGLSNMGAIYFRRKQFQKALELYQRSVRQDPRFADGWFNLGSTYGTLGEFQKSIDAFQTGLKYEPNHVQMNQFLATSYEMIKDLDNAKIYRERAELLRARGAK